MVWYKNHGNKRQGFMTALLCLIFVHLPVLAQELKVRTVMGNVYVEGPGVWKDLIRSDEHKEDALLSPDGAKVIYHDGFKQNKSPSMTLTVLDAQTGEVIRKIQLDIPGQFLIFVDWFDNRRVVVQTSNNYTIFDVESGRKIHNIFCVPPGLASLSPDRRIIVFQETGGLRGAGSPPEYHSDYVRLALIEKAPPGGKSYDYSVYMTIYPEVTSWGKFEFKRYDDLNERHHIKSALVWSRNSENVAFVEEHRGKFWLVVLDVIVKDEAVTSTHKRIELLGLAEEVKELIPGQNIRGVEWLRDGKTIKVVSRKSTWLANIEAGEAHLEKKGNDLN